MSELSIGIRVLRRLLRATVRPFRDHVAWAFSTFVPPEEGYEAFSKQDRHLLKKHFYLPIPDEADLAFAKGNSELVGIDINIARCFSFMERVVMPYKGEFLAFPRKRVDRDDAYYLVNGTFMAIDGNLYYSIIRHAKPRRIVEIGSGNSTLLAVNAIRKNLQEGGAAADLFCVEPFPRSFLRDGSFPEIQLIEKRVQEIDLGFFEELQAGDVLFIDSTHVLKEGGDVWWEYCEILPRLAPGVLVHIHDVSLPRSYPEAYARNHWYWNEQYLLQAFLTFNSRFEILWPGNYLMIHREAAMREAFSPEYDEMIAAYPNAEPASFWMRVKDGAG